MPHSVAMHEVCGLDEVELLLAGEERPVVLILDADNTLVAQGVSDGEFGAAVTDATDRLRAHPLVERAIVLSNGAQRGVADVIPRGNKPFTTRRRLGLDRKQVVWVIGDQIITDGMLAWRLGGTYLRLVVDQDNESWGQMIMRRLGALVEPVFFHEASQLPG